MVTFSISPSKNFSDEKKRLLAVTSFEVTNFVFSITNENNSFSITIPGYWTSTGSAETFNKFRVLLGLGEQDDTKLHEEEVRKRGNHIKIGDKKYSLSDLDTYKNEVFGLLRHAEYNEPEVNVFGLDLTYTKILSILDTNYNYIVASTTRYTLESGIYEISDNSFMLSF